MEKKPKLEFRCCYSICENYYPDKQINFVKFPETCPQFQQKRVNGSIDQHIIHCKDCEKTSKWVEACGNGLVKSIYDVTKNSYICEKHFEGGKGPTKENPNPVPITGDVKIKTEDIDMDLIKEEKVEIEEHPLEDIKEEMLDCDWIKQEEDQPQCSKQNIKNKLCASSTQTKYEGLTIESIFKKCKESEEDSVDEECEDDSMDDEFDEDLMDEEDSEDSSEATETSEFETEESEDNSNNMSAAEYQEQSMKRNKRECYYCTGFHYDQISNLLNFFGASPKVPDTTLTPIQQLIIVLMRLRRGTEICDLAIRNGTTSKFVIQLVKTWVLFMHSQFAKKYKEQMPKKVDFKKLKAFQFLKNVNPLNNGGSMAPFVLVCACFLKFQAS